MSKGMTRFKTYRLYISSLDVTTRPELHPGICALLSIRSLYPEIISHNLLLSRHQYAMLHGVPVLRINKIIPFQEYSLTSIFLFGYTWSMKTLWTALTEPNRLYIVELLRDGPLTVGEITKRSGLQQPQVSKHLKVLSEAAIVEVHAQANRRIYTLRREPFQELETWLHSFRRLWEERFDRLDDYLLETQTTEHNTSNRNEDNNV
jgi:DNA-binding transcriptional ArsR family regulator